MEPQDFLKKHGADLLQVLRNYDSGKIGHEEAREFAWAVIADCEESAVPRDAAYTTSEHAFWAAIWSVVHLADQEHWADNCARPAVQKYIRILSGEDSLPSGEKALRP
jgi:hypothetical protein